MNAETPAIEADASTSTAVVPIVAMTPVALFAPGNVETLIERVKREARAEAAKLDISTPKGRAAIASLALKVAKTKTYMDDAGKTLTDEYRKAAEVIHAERRTIIAELVALKDEVRAPLTDWENAEKERVAGHEAALVEIDRITVTPDGVSSQEVRDRIAQLDALPPRDWGLDFAYKAETRLSTARRLLAGDLAVALQREAETAECARLQAEADERARQDAARQQAEREARIAAEAADKARREAEAKADRERQETLRAAAEERARVEREAQAEQRRIEAERQAAHDRAEEAERRRAADAAAAKEREEAAARKAESDRIAAEEKAKREQEEAVAAERKRQADEQARVEREAAVARAEAQRRADNKAHQAAVNNAAVKALLALTHIDEQTAKQVVIVVARGEIPKMKMEYSA